MILVNVKTELDGQHQEELEDVIKESVRRYNVDAEIYNTVTGNSMTVHKRG